MIYKENISGSERVCAASHWKVRLSGQQYLLLAVLIHIWALGIEKRYQV